MAHNRDAVGEPGIEPADRLHISAIAGQNRCELCGHREDRIRDPHDIVSQLGWIAGECPAVSVLDEDAASEGLDAMAVTAPPARPITTTSGAAVQIPRWMTASAAFLTFNASDDRRAALDVGAGSFIKGCDDGVQGMKVSGAGGVIPPNATLMFDVELLAV